MLPRSPSPYNIAPSPPAPSIKPGSGKDRDRQRDILSQQQAQQQAINRKKLQSAPAMNILRALDPPRTDSQTRLTRPHSEETFAPLESSHVLRERESGDRKEKKGFWGVRDKDRDKEKEKERDRVFERERGRVERRDDEGQAELTRMIGAFYRYVSCWGLTDLSV